MSEPLEAKAADTLREASLSEQLALHRLVQAAEAVGRARGALQLAEACAGPVGRAPNEEELREEIGQAERGSRRRSRQLSAARQRRGRIEGRALVGVRS